MSYLKGNNWNDKKEEALPEVGSYGRAFLYSTVLMIEEMIMSSL
ncbi:hypothetical protein ACOI1C_06470 [Bacillus sp. DJP31]